MDSMNTGGSEKSASSLIIGMKKITDEFEFKICVLGSDNGFKWFFKKNRINVDFLNTNSISLKTLLTFYNYLRKEKPFLVHSHQTVVIFFCGLVRYLTKIPYLVATIRIHELWKMRNELKVKLAKLPCKIAFRKYDSVVCVADSVKRFEEKAEFHTPSKLSVIHNGIILENYKNLKRTSNLREELGFDRAAKIILNVGRLDEKKGLRFLVEAMPQILSKVACAKLLIVGDGNFRSNLEEKIKELKLEDSVFLLGLKNVDEVQNIYQNSDIFVFPTLTEALSNVLLESMINGLPVISTNTGGNPEVIEDGKSGILIPMEDSRAISDNVCNLLSNPEKMKQLSENAQKRVREHFSLEKTVTEYLKLYKSLK